MDFRSELEQHTRGIRAKIDAQIEEIHQLNDSIMVITDKISTLQTEIDGINHEVEPQKRLLAEKQSLLLQFKTALSEHETSLLANQMLEASQKSIQKNQATLSKRLTELERTRISISENIRKFHADHPYISAENEQKWNFELLEEQQKLDTVQTSISHLQKVQDSLNVIVKIFLSLLQSIGWRTNPLADEHKRLATISEEIITITQTLSEYNTAKEELDALHVQEELVAMEKQQILQDKETLEKMDETKRAISESTTTIQNLKTKIKSISSECSQIEKKINKNKLEPKTKEQQALIKEKAGKVKVLQEKSLQLANIDSPARVALKTTLKDSLLQIATHQERYKQDQEVFRSTHGGSQFFKPAHNNLRDTPNYLALAKLQQAIKVFQKGLNPDSQEHRLLSQITTKLLLWQMAEDSTHPKISMEARQQAHQKTNSEIAALVAELPLDNPLHASLHYIAALTEPVVEEPSATLSSRKGGKRG